MPAHAGMLENHIAHLPEQTGNNSEEIEAVDDRTKEETEKDETDLYNISNFSV